MVFGVPKPAVVVSAAVTDLVGVDVEGLDVDARLGLFDELETVSRLLGAVTVRVLSSLDRSGVCEERFGMTTATFCEQRHGVDRATVRDRLRVGRVLAERLPRIFEQYSSGALSWDRARLLAGVCNSRNRDALAAAQEQLLVLSECEPTFKVWAALVRDLARYADGDGVEPDEARSRVGSRRCGDALILDGCFVGTDAENFEQLVDAATDRLWRAYSTDRERCAEIEVPSRVELRAEALLELVRHGAAALAARSGRRPPSEMSVVVDADHIDELDPRLAAVLDGTGAARHATPRDHSGIFHDHPDAGPRSGCRCDTGMGALVGVPVTTRDGTRLWFTAAQWQLLVCHTNISEILMDRLGTPIAVRDRLRHPSREMRRALEVRDGGCVFPGCDAPPGWCDAHHVIEWAHGGTTATTNLVLLCRRHHGIIHRTGWHITPTPHDHHPGPGDSPNDGLFTITTARGLTMTTHHRPRPPRRPPRRPADPA